MNQVKTQNIQTVIEYDLADFATGSGPYGYDTSEVQRQLSAQMEQIDPGAMVRIRVGKFKPLSGYFSFLRPDLLVQIISGDVEAAKAWHAEFQTEVSIDY